MRFQSIKKANGEVEHRKLECTSIDLAYILISSLIINDPFLNIGTTEKKGKAGPPSHLKRMNVFKIC